MGQLNYWFIATVIIFAISGFLYADNIYVSIENNGTVQKFNSSGSGTVFMTGLSNPMGLAFNSRGNLFIACQGEGTIREFDLNGSNSVFVTAGCQGLTIDNRDSIWTTNWNWDRNSCFAQEFCSDGSANRSISVEDHMEPLGIACDRNGDVYIAINPNNYWAGGVRKFVYVNGFYSSSYWFGRDLQGPTGLTFDIYGNLYCADIEYGASASHNGTIYKFDANGNKTVFATGLANPISLDFGSDGGLYVTCTGNGTIVKFDQYANMSLFASGLSGPAFIAIQVPEPTMLLLVMAGVAMVRKQGYSWR